MKTNNILIKLFFLLGLTFNIFLSYAQELQLDKEIRDKTINEIALMLEENYVLPEIGASYSNHLKSNLRDGGYDKIKKPEIFVEKIMSDLNEIYEDKHLKVNYNPRYIQNIRNRPTASKEELEEERKAKIIKERKRNYGFKEIKILTGNIGYLRFDEFPSDRGSNTIISSMGFLQYCDALIVDLRYNSGGNPEIIMLLGGYFFDEDKTFEFSGIYNRIKDKYYQQRSLLYIPGNRLSDVELFILVGPKTFSAAEAFAYDLKNLNRATIIGENTVGGAHAANSFIVNDYFLIQMPFARPINPVTNSNWEGVGVDPDIKCDSENALQIAYEYALRKIVDKNENENYINSLGYALIRESMLDMAISVFKKNVELYPNSANAYDSLGEAYMLLGNYELAIENYTKSVELNPDNTNGRNNLEELKKRINKSGE